MTRDSRAGTNQKELNVSDFQLHIPNRLQSHQLAAPK